MSEKVKPIEEILCEVLKETFKAVDSVYQKQKEGRRFAKGGSSRLVFPRYGRGLYKDDKLKGNTEQAVNTRVSEQELRFIFVEQFNKICDKYKEMAPYFYSVETPTVYRYVFSKEKEPRLAELGRKNEKGKQEGTSGNFDLTIHNEKGERIYWIEFKAAMHGQKDFSKDFLKLNQEAEKGVFVHLLEAADRYTFNSLIQGNKKSSPKLEKLGKAKYICHVLPDENKQSESQTYSLDGGKLIKLPWGN